MPGLPSVLSSGAYAIDELTVVFGVLFAVIWVLGAAYSAMTLSRGERSRLFAYYVPAAIGGIAVAFAADAISFYLCFALMALPAWGLVAHSGTAEARRGARVYLAVTIIGEALLLAALMVLSADAGSIQLEAMRIAMADSAHADLVFGLTVGAFALKLGAIGVSGVLPLTYGPAPTGAAAALAGASIKVGVLGMLRLLPLGMVADPGWATALVVLGFASAFGAALLGSLTRAPRAVLGYSSASQMGLVTVAVGVGMLDPAAGTLAVSAAVAYSLHHGLAKTALFLGEDVYRHATGRAATIARAALALPALALVGVPLTSGFVAKYALKEAAHAVPVGLTHTVELLLPWAAVGTALLMLRFFALLESASSVAEKRGRGPAIIWGAMLVLVAGASWVWPAEWSHAAAKSALAPALLWAGVWPGLLAVLVAVTASAVARRGKWLQGLAVPPGDLLLVVDAAVVRAAAPRSKASGGAAARSSRGPRDLSGLLEAEDVWTTWSVAAGIFVVVAIVLALLSA